MKKATIIIQWIFTALFGLCAIGNGFHWTSLLLALSAVLMMPLTEIRQSLKLKSFLAITLSVVLLFVGVAFSPASEQEIPKDSFCTESSPAVLDTENNNNNSKTESAIADTTSNKNNSSLDAHLDTDSKPKENNTSSSITPVGTGKAESIDLTTITAYSNKPFTIINDNIPNFSAKELELKAYENYSNLDSLGRCRTAIAVCGKEIMPRENEERGSISSIKPTGWVQAKYSGVSGGYLYNRCHLIGWQLSAENANKKNLITGTRYMNTEGMLPFENMVADYIKETGNHVAYRITPIFEGSNLLCSGVQMEAYSIEDKGEGICFNVYCYNVQPNITIDYATGKSSGPSNNTNSTSSSENSNPNPTPTPTPVPTPEPTPEPEYTPTPPTNTQSQMVWIPNSGSKYHSKSSCSNMKNPSHVTIDQAVSMGYGPCKKCY